MADLDSQLVPKVRLTTNERDLSASAIDAFVGALGGRRQLTEILDLSSGDPIVDRVIVLLTDPMHAGKSLRTLCALAGLTVADFFRAFERAMLRRGELLSATKIAARMVDVVDDVMRRAAPHDEPCPCGVQPLPTCVACKGTGTRRVLPDLDRQKVALELSKLLTKGGGILVQQNNVSVAPAGGSRGALVDLQTAVHAILKPRRPLGSAAPTIDVPPRQDPA